MINHLAQQLPNSATLAIFALLGSVMESKRQLFIQIAIENQKNYIPYLLETDDRVRDSLANSTLHHSIGPLPPLPPPADPAAARPTTSVKVVNSDTFNCAESLHLQGSSNVTVLNMANPINAGGGYFSGTGAQEEALCRRSTLYLTIRPELGLHPIPEHGGIFSPDVLVFRTGDGNNCRVLPQISHWWTTVISVAAKERPRLTTDRKDYAYEPDRVAMREKIRTILRIAASERMKILVLGAFGCGVFMNPPEQVANLFKTVFQEEEFKGRFHEIWFPIMERGGSNNFAIFQRILDGMQF